jgi:membrane protein
MRQKFKNLWEILKQTFKAFADLNITSLSAALAYYTIFSIAPMLIVIISLLAIFYGRDAIEGKIYAQIQSFVGNDAALEIQQLIRNASISKDITWASAIGIIALIFAATGVFTQIQNSINLIWRLKAKPKKGWVKMLLNRLLSFSMLITLGFLMLVSLVINALMDALVDRLIRIFPQMAVYAAYGINLLLTFITTTILFGIIFKVLPDAKIKWKDVRVGAITTAILFMLGRLGIGYYLGRSNISSSYGAAGSLVIILLWVYYSAIILYFGAAFTKAYAHCSGRRIYPDEYAVWIEQLEVEHKDSLQEQKKEVKETLPIEPEENKEGQLTKKQ